MSRRLNFNVENGWELVWNRSLTSDRTPSNRLLGIQETIVPLLFDKFVVAVHCYSPYAQSKSKGWRWAGYAVRRIRTGLTTNNAFDSDAGTKHPYWLNRFTLLMYDPIVPNYGLSFEYARWLPDINITVWQFLGDDYDSTEALIRQARADIDNLRLLYERLIQ